MRQIIKFCGLTVEQVAALDKVLKSDFVKASARYHWYDGDMLAVSPIWGFPVFAKRLRVQASSGSDGYVYELTLDSELILFLYGNSGEGCRERVIVPCPRHVLLAIFEAVGKYPDNDQPETRNELGWAKPDAIQKYLAYPNNRRC